MDINTDIAKTYITSNKKLTAVAVFGVLLGMGIYIFMNTMIAGFDRTTESSMFKAAPHIRIYNDDQISSPLVSDNNVSYLIINPKIVPNNNRILNPKMVMETIKGEPDVTIVTPQVTASTYYTIGTTELYGIAYGVIPDETDAMFDVNSMMVDGNFDMLKSIPNAIVIGSGIADKMNVGLQDNINLSSSKGVNKTFKIVGIFKANNSAIDKTKSYINVAAAQQLLKESTSYITDINVSISDPEKAEQIGEKLSRMTGYKAEGWKQTNETLMAASSMRKIVMSFVSTTLLIVAGFGIYNILNMTVSQKINDIAILKAMGFKGRDVIRIFVFQALSIGVMGMVGGIIMAIVLVILLKQVYIGGDIGYFPIDYEPLKFLQGIALGLFITFLAGYIPARKAAKVDPVSIFRK